MSGRNLRSDNRIKIKKNISKNFIDSQNSSIVVLKSVNHSTPKIEPKPSPKMKTGENDIKDPEQDSIFVSQLSQSKQFCQNQKSYHDLLYENKIRPSHM